MTQAEKNTARKEGHESKLEVLVVGAGIGGLTCAIDAHLAGFAVRIVEKRAKLDELGDSLGLQPSCLHTVKKWPGFYKRLCAIDQGSTFNLYNSDGEFLRSMSLGASTSDNPAIGVLRSEFHTLLHRYAGELGLEVELGRPVAEYFETEAGRGGIRMACGEEVTADLVVAADGVGSVSWPLILGEKRDPVPTGYSVYRANFPVSLALENEVIKDRFGGEDISISGFFGRDAHIMVGKSSERMVFLMTHKDKDPSRVKQRTPVSPCEVLDAVANWSPVVQEIVKAAPEDSIIDWKLLWNDPQPTWVSPLGRVVQIGDAAHTFLPTSAYGASMAMEDGHSLVECLRHVTGSEDIPLATRVHNKLRFERTKSAQQMGIQVRELIHKTDWSSVPTGEVNGLELSWAPWLLNHDPEEYARSKFDDCAEHMLSGAPFQNTNTPSYVKA